MSQFVSSVFEKQKASLQTTLFRSYAYQHYQTNKWKLVIQGRRSYDIPTRMNLTRRLMLSGLIKRLDCGEEILSNEMFQSRVAGFLVSAEPGERVKLQIGPEVFELQRRIKKNGLFGGRVTIDSDYLQDYKRFGPKQIDGPLLFLESGITRCEAKTQILLAEKYGLSIISDIDDTIKQTDVSDRKQMLERTFVQPFLPIEGMVDLYQDWAKNYPALFHYVSSSPCQLYKHLEHFLDDFEFPIGSIQLRWFTLREEFLKKWKLSRGRNKEEAIRDLLKRMPYRCFLLIGDSSESDPEIYAKVAAKYPESVLGIAIRNVTSSPMGQSRLATMRDYTNNIPVRLFDSPKELHGWIDELNVMSKLHLRTSSRVEGVTES